jgi:hypothetical protein
VSIFELCLHLARLGFFIKELKCLHGIFLSAFSTETLEDALV